MGSCVSSSSSSSAPVDMWGRLFVRLDAWVDPAELVVDLDTASYTEEDEEAETVEAAAALQRNPDSVTV